MVDPGIPVEGKIQPEPPKQFDGQDLGADCGYPAAYDGVAGAKMRGFMGFNLQKISRIWV
jgi:hypothetical protein